ncbi:putative peptide/polyketide synthetase [Photorhabdus asymbiotica]|uniref:Peptide/polyketide synthetase n=1 Tax=Photorhabdus asymbiotica subsp. asymbiotica (strain ATCC 43949 / 3105-77) TaxID=553480 RepID=C7BK69_PHOAA|nr:putative peptide/polyketide synthetase [Photorhabdus asymbiotica]
MSLSHKIAVVGMSGIFPGASSIKEYWEMLIEGNTGIREIPDELLTTESKTNKARYGENYITRKGILDREFEFDYRFFKMSKQEACLLDPQQRKFLQVCWNALEDAGYSPNTMQNRNVGVYASCSPSTYAEQVSKDMDLSDWQQSLMLFSNNLRDLVACRVSSLLDLHGPSLNVQTACSSSMSALHEAYRGLLFGDCDVAVAGGVAIRLPQEVGYVYHEQGVYSHDGACRPFDHHSSGTVSGNGAAAVILKRLEDAEKDGNRIYAVIDCVMANNDGNRKVGFTAPSVVGQRTLFQDALEFSDIDIADLSYVEAHGTATPLGDPIEFEAMSQAIAAITPKSHFCYLGSVKANIGHLDSAAGISGFIKTCLILWHRKVPPHPTFKAPNPQLKFEGSPFLINKQVIVLSATGILSAGVNAVGIGGTNVVAILSSTEPATCRIENSGRYYFPLSVNDKEVVSLNQQAAASHIACVMDNAATISSCMAEQNRGFPIKTGIWLDWQAGNLKQNLPAATCTTSLNKLIFVLPGGGSFFKGALSAVAQEFPYIIDEIGDHLDLIGDKSKILSYLIDKDGASDHDGFGETLTENLLTTFFLNHALLLVLRQLGIRPDMLIGHSLGEYNCAVAAGAMTVEMAVKIIMERARIVELAPKKFLLNVFCKAEALQDFDKYRDIEIISYNSDANHTILVEPSIYSETTAFLRKNRIGFKKINVVAAAHSQLLEPYMENFDAFLAEFSFMPLQVPMISNLNGSLLQKGTCLDKDYWVQHLRQPVRFAGGMEIAIENGANTFVQVGVGEGLARQVNSEKPINIFSLVGNSIQQTHDALLGAIGIFYHLGLTPIFAGLPTPKISVRHLPLPPYQFKSTVCKMEPGKTNQGNNQTNGSPDLYHEGLVFDAEIEDTAITQLPNILSVNQLIRKFSCEEDLQAYWVTDHEIPALFVDITGFDWCEASDVYWLKEKINLIANQNKRSRIFLTIRAQRLPDLSSLLAPRNFCVCVNQELPTLKTTLLVSDSFETKHYCAFVNKKNVLNDAYFISDSRIYIPAYSMLEKDDFYSDEEQAGDEKTIIMFGGAGKIGLNLLYHLMLSTSYHFILVGRKPLNHSLHEFLSNKGHEYHIDEKIISEIYSQRHRVDYICCDLTQENARQQVISHLHEEGVKNIDAFMLMTADSYSASIRKQLIDVTEDDVHQQLMSKAHVLNEINKLEESLKPKVNIIFSSNASRLGGIGMFSYSIANGILDSWAQQKTGNTRRISINFDAFRFTPDPNPPANFINEEALTQLMIGLLNKDISRTLILSNERFPTRIKQWVHLAGEQFTRLAQEESIDETGDITIFVKKQWEKLLGEEDLTAESHFFNLGGHSLMAFQLFSALRQFWKIEVVLIDLAKNPTLGSFTLLVQERMKNAVYKEETIERISPPMIDALMSNILGN